MHSSEQSISPFYPRFSTLVLYFGVMMKNCSSMRGLIRDSVCGQRFKKDNNGCCNSVSPEAVCDLTHSECSSLFINRLYLCKIEELSV